MLRQREEIELCSLNGKGAKCSGTRVLIRGKGQAAEEKP